ncbi:LytR/AlgR family response regulator transcription factor [Deminuibacter soli]|uniref:DNA-binding response regulator n=1 Tax=Deminuibacter soli TaxID=2291815 RepID=A0A3E1NH79_9BACT|nr:LytTR family DNA-binding domain-containing protein [Deminuibacter soli]RFM27148.1 DNA-binding response regulator [Deminuibacter soli]
MNLVIIEDEKFLAEELEHTIGSLRSNWQVVKTLASVKEAIAWFSSNNQYQLVFSDIQLGDGLSFDIFKQVSLRAPVIFCTAYNEYAIDAFKNKGIDYILKPYSRQSIREAIERYEALKQQLGSPADYQAIVDLLRQSQQHKPAPASLLVNHKDKIIPVNTAQVALFYIHNGLVNLIDFNKNQYIINQPLDELENSLGSDFYRTDRQHLVNRRAIKDVSQYFARKLLLNLLVDYPEPITIRKEKNLHFLDWLAKN